MQSDCITAASEMLRSMDTSVDPCHDFFEYACGSWTRFNTIEEDESRTDTFTAMRNDLTSKLKGDTPSTLPIQLDPLIIAQSRCALLTNSALDSFLIHHRLITGSARVI